MFIPDLDTNGYFAKGPDVRSIGWLESDHPYRRGPVSSAFLLRLREHVESAYEPITTRGWHVCTLCPEGTETRCGSTLMIPTPQRFYLAPGMIVHYIEAHDYQPPEKFVEAVMACPPQKSADYMALFERHKEAIFAWMDGMIINADANSLDRWRALRRARSG